MKWLVFILTLSACCLSSTAQAEKSGTLSLCQTLQSRIGYYEALRREGGSAQEMDNWRKQRRAQQKEFGRLRCSRWGKQLQQG